MDFDISGENIRLEDLKKWCEDRMRAGHTYFELVYDLKYNQLGKDSNEGVIGAQITVAELKSHAV